MDYFHIQNIDSKIKTSGKSSAFLGHKVKNKKNDQDPEGIFAEWHWDGERLTINNDKLGMYPLYYYYKEGELCVSANILKIIECGVDTEYDYDALSVFLRMGMFVGDATAFKYIKALPPGAEFVWSDNKLSKQSQEFDADLSVSQITREDAIDKYQLLFQESIEKRLPADDQFMIPLSGGRDSRHIFLEFVKRGYRPKAITHRPHPNCSDEDVRIAQLLAKKAGVEHVIVDQRVSRLKTEIDKNILTSMCSDEHAQILTMAQDLKGMNIHTVYDGIGGDTLSEGKLFDQTPMDLFRKKDVPALADYYLKQWTNSLTKEALDNLLSEEMREQLTYERAKKAVEEEVRKHIDKPNPLSAFIFWSRTRREISLIPNAILQEYCPTVYSPYLDYALCRFLFSLPFEIVAEGAFHSETIQKAYPDFADVPYETPSAPRTTVPVELKNFHREFAFFGLKNLSYHSRFFRKKFLIPRLLKGLVQKNYVWYAYPLIIYFAQLEKIKRGNFS